MLKEMIEKWQEHTTQIFNENGYKLDYVKEINAPLARLIKTTEGN